MRGPNSIAEIEQDEEQEACDKRFEAFKKSMNYEFAVTDKYIQLLNDPDRLSQVRADAEKFVDENWGDYV